MKDKLQKMNLLRLLEVKNRVFKTLREMLKWQNASKWDMEVAERLRKVLIAIHLEMRNRQIEMPLESYNEN